MRSGRRVEVLAERDFRLYFFGQLTSFIGTGMLPVALSFAVLARGGSAGEVGLVLGASTLPLVLLLLVGGVVADRYDRRMVMVAADALRAVAQGVLAVWILVGQPPLWGFLLCEAVLGVGWAFFQPAMTGLTPKVAKGEHLLQGNALLGMADWTGFLVGPALAGVIVAASGPGWAVAADAASYLVSVVCLAAMRVRAREAPTSETFARRLAGGWRAFRERTWLWAIVGQFSLFGLVVFPPFFVLGAVVAKESLGGALAWGVILASQGAGSVVGGLLVLRSQPRKPLFVAEAAMLLWAPLLASLALRAPVWVVGVFAFGAGLSFGVFGPLWDTTMQRELPPEVLSRASAYDWFGSFAFLPVGYAIVGVVSDRIGVNGTLWLGAAWLALTTGVVLTLPQVTGLVARPAAPLEEARVA
jgi:MFS family permease